MTNPNILILFDLGGVLADLGTPATSMRLPMTNEAFWELWLSSGAVRDYELGRIDGGTFFRRLSGELRCTEPVNEFRQRFLRWRLTPFSGTDALLTGLAGRYELALLSNTNAVHWPMVRGQSPAFDRLHHVFVSYETGKLKPEPAAFAHVLEATKRDAKDVVFLDDTAANVEAATRTGMTAIRVRGIDETRKALRSVGVDGDTR